MQCPSSRWRFADLAQSNVAIANHRTKRSAAFAMLLPPFASAPSLPSSSSPPPVHIYLTGTSQSPLTRRRSSGVGPCSIPLLLRVNSPSLVPPIVSYLIRSTLRVYSQSSPSGSLSIFLSPIWIKTEAGAVSTDPLHHPQAHMPRIQTIPQQAPDQRTTPIIII